MAQRKGFEMFKNGGTGGSYSEEYHKMMRHSSWIMIKNLIYRPKSAATNPAESTVRLEPSEGDVITVFSQFGEIVDIRFLRHRSNGKFLGVAFLKYEKPESAMYAADAMNSYSDKNEEIYLSPTYEGGWGLRVDRCEEKEVPPIVHKR
ncbi:RNA-binding protein motif protein, X-linked 2 [Angomonas deanei]|nr:RNA-binding protein motif protein, X-linked 2 [Angomonas deanei]|eukprot:EPY20976.1 RNA-binding protein motif protein, X-linked 2 [Angomonas deanei]